MKKKFNLSLQDQQNLFDRISRRESGEISGGNIDQQQSTIVNKPPEGNYSFNYDPPPNNFNNRISPGRWVILTDSNFPKCNSSPPKILLTGMIS